MKVAQRPHRALSCPVRPRCGRSGNSSCARHGNEAARSRCLKRRHAISNGAAFGHSLGHGIGLEVHEAPRLAKSVEAPLVSGAVVTIEPGIYRPGWGGVRIEDDVLVTAQGHEILTATVPKSIDEIEALMQAN